MKRSKTIGSTLLFCLFALLLAAQESSAGGFMHTNGKIYVVVAVIVLIFLGIVVFLIRLNGKVNQLENQIFDHDERTEK